MVYLLVLITSAAGIALLFLIRSLLRSRNVRRIVHVFRRGLSAFHERRAKGMPEDTPVKVKRHPRNSIASLQQARTLLRQAEVERSRQNARAAERTLIRALTLQPDAGDVKIALAGLYLESSRAPKAEALYREILQSTEESSLFSYLGRACAKQGKFSEAWEAYAAALRLDPRNPERQADLGRASMAIGRFNDAAALFEEALTKRLRATELLHLLAQCYTQLRELPKAEETYRAINRLEPGNEEVKQKIASLAGTPYSVSLGA